MAVCPKCGEENPDRFRMCGFCGAPLRDEAPSEEERKPITVLFVDMVGSTSLGEELDPEDVRALLEPYYARLRAALERHGGTVEKFIGDAVVAVFGAPIAHEDDPERAVRAGLSILDEIQALNEEDPTRRLEVRVGINTGEALVALGARVREGQGMAWGDVMNTAARIQSAAPVNRVLVDDLTYAAAMKAIEFERADPISAKGKAEPVPVWVVLGAKERTDDSGRETPFVGRGSELAELLDTWHAVEQERRPALATVIGPPGVGKSRLVEELSACVPQASIHTGRCLSYGEGITYWPITEIVKAAAGIRQGDDDETRSAKLGDLLESLPSTDVDQLRTIAAALANLVGAPRTPRGTYVATEISQSELHWGLRRLLELLAEERPLLLVFEDVHWAEQTLVELIMSVATTAVGPILVLVTGRPELADVHPPLASARNERRVLNLEPLAEDESRKLLTDLLGTAASAAAVDRLIHNAGGNPLFLEETARMVSESTMLAPDWSAAGDLPVPSSLQGLVGARLDALEPTEKRVAQHASVAGGEFWSGAVEYLEDSTNRERELEAIERRDFIRERHPSTIAGEREWSFKHAVVREVAYGRLPKGRRVGLHVRFAEWVRGLSASDEEHVEVLAYHLERACRLARDVRRSPVPPPVDEAVATLRRAAERAERREGLREAHRYYERALAIAPEDVETQLELQLGKARTLIGLGNLSQADAELTQLEEQAKAVGRLDLRCEALIGLANIAYKNANAEDERRHIDEAEALAGVIGDRRLRVRAAYESATGFAQFVSDFDGAIEKLVDGVAVAEEADDLALQIEGNMRLGVILFNIGDLGRAQVHLSRCLELASEIGSLKEQARATCFSAYLAYHYRGDLAEAERLARQTAEWFERTGDTFFELQNLRLLALLALARYELSEAEELLKRALPLALEKGPLFAAETYRLFVEALIGQGRVDEARKLAVFADKSIPEDDVWSAHAKFAMAFVAFASGDGAAAARFYAGAIGRLVQAQAWIDVIEGRIAYARIADSLGHTATAADELAQARAECARIVAPGLEAFIESELARLDADVAPPPRPKVRTT